MLINRPFWQNLIEEYWKEKNVIWLMGVRRIGKTSLCESLSDIEYLDCEKPRTREFFSDPEGFLETKKGKRIILDEIHRLDNPSEVLKLASDHYKTVKIVATGSSTLGASSKFRDTLAGRKKEIWLTPLLMQEMAIFGNEDIRHRFLFGGFPYLFTEDKLQEDKFHDWIDAYWAKDIQEMFSLNKRYSFQKFTELLLNQSGGQFEATKFADACEVTRQTIVNYLTILEETFVVDVIRPYSSHKPSEIVRSPKVYGLDTGFVCYAKGWENLRSQDLGLLWEHCVLNEIHGLLQTRRINYWRDKKGHEVDFIYKKGRSNSIIAIECKFSILEDKVDNVINIIGKNLKAFRVNYPNGENFVVAHDIDASFTRKYHEITITFISLKELINKLSN